MRIWCDAPSLGMVVRAGLPGSGLSSRKIFASGGLAETLISTVPAPATVPPAVAVAPPVAESALLLAAPEGGAAGGEPLVTCQITTARSAPATSAPAASRPRLPRAPSVEVEALLAKSAEGPLYEVLLLDAPRISTLPDESEMLCLSAAAPGGRRVLVDDRQRHHGARRAWPGAARR